MTITKKRKTKPPHPHHQNSSDFPDISSQGAQSLHCTFKLLPSQGTIFKVQDKLSDLLEQLWFLAISLHVEMEASRKTATRICSDFLETEQFFGSADHDNLKAALFSEILPLSCLQVRLGSSTNLICRENQFKCVCYKSNTFLLEEQICPVVP